MDDDEISEEIEIIEYDENDVPEIQDEAEDDEVEQIPQIEEKIVKPLRIGCCLNNSDERVRLQQER